MPRTAQQWKDLLGLAKLPDPEYLEALTGLEDVETIDDSGMDPAHFQLATKVAARFGYRATLVLEPIAGGQRIEAPLQGK